MTVRSRRSVLAGIGAAILVGGTSADAADVTAIRAIAFDAFPLFDPRPIAATCKMLRPEHGDALAALWNAKLFGYTWLLTAAGRYRDFETLSAIALDAAAARSGVSLAPRERDELVALYGELDIWPDVRSAILALKGSGIRLAVLSNLGERALRANLTRAGLSAAFDHVLSTDRVKAFKPSPNAYAMAVRAFGRPPDRIAFAAFAEWDAAGAAWFGYRTIWINRLGASTEGMIDSAIGVTPNLDKCFLTYLRMSEVSLDAI